MEEELTSLWLNLVFILRFQNLLCLSRSNKRSNQIVFVNMSFAEVANRTTFLNDRSFIFKDENRVRVVRIDFFEFAFFDNHSPVLAFASSLGICVTFFDVFEVVLTY